MAAGTGNTAQTRRKERIVLPVKRTINLAGVGEKPLNLKIAIPAIILIVLAAALLSKFAVVDRLAAVSRAQRKVTVLQGKLDDAYEEMASYGDVKDVYAHYTYADMTAEELSRVERSAVVDLIQRVVQPRAELGAWFVSGNQLTITISGSTLQDINLVAQLLDADELVDFCTVSTAVMSESNDRRKGSLTDSRTAAADADGITPVTANVIVYLKASGEVQ